MNLARLFLLSVPLFSLIFLGNLMSCAEPEPDGRLLLRELQNASVETPDVRYRFEYDTSTDGQVETRISGWVWLQRLDLSGANYRARVEAELTLADGSRQRVRAVRREHDIWAVDEESRTVWTSSLYAGGTSLMAPVLDALMYTFFDPQSLDEEIDAEKVTYLGPDRVHGESCQQFYVEYEEDDEDSIWCLGFEDRLPRALSWLGPAGDQSRLEIYELDTESRLAKVDLAIEIPPGYDQRLASFGPEPGSLADEWELATPAGESVALQDLRGEIVVLDFWATWCPPCWDSLAGLQALQMEFADRPVRFLAPNTQETGDPTRFFAAKGWTTPILLEADEVHRTYVKGSLPALVVIDAQGRHIGSTIGYFGLGSEEYQRQLIETGLSSSDSVD